MKMHFLLALSVFAFACAHKPKCGTPEGAKVVYTGEMSCQVRIRQVTVGSEMKVPASVKTGDLSSYEMEWVDPILVNGEVHLGYFKLKPKTAAPSGGKN